MAYAEQVSRKLLMQDPETKTVHETPKNMRTAVNGPDKDKWLPSMKRELKAMKDKGVWEEVVDPVSGRKYWANRTLNVSLFIY